MTSTRTSTSTSPSPFAGSATGQQHVSGLGLPGQDGRESWIKKPEVVISIMGMIITGIIGFSSAYTLLKDDINKNKTDISVIEEKNTNYDNKLKELSEDIKTIPIIERELAVVQEKVSTNRRSIEENRNTYNKSIQGAEKPRP